MTFKYIFTLGAERLPGYGHLYDLCHIPLDGVIIKALQLRGLDPLPRTWSRLDSYDEYLNIQKWVRDHFKCGPALDVEFRLWMDALPGK